MKRQVSAQVASPHRIPVAFCAGIAAVIWAALLSSTALAQRGDMNCDGTVTAADVPFFIEALVDPGSFGGCDISRADMNADTLIDGLDIQPFVAVLFNPCVFPFIICGGVCVDPTSDRHNCGGCGRQCAENESCINGFCEGW